MSPKNNIPLWFLAVLTLSGTLAMHIFVPVLPLVGQDFHADLHEVQLTLSVYILGLAIGQLFYGPLADSFGRRPILIFGMLLYSAASIGALFAANIEMLIGMRFIQALGGCTGLLLGRAIVRDTSTGADTTKRLSLMNMMVMFGPGLAPLLGGLLASISGWRSIFIALSILGLINLILVYIFIQDSALKRETSVKIVASNYKQLISSPKFLGLTLGGGLATTSMYAFLSVASYIVIQQLGGTLHEVGIYLALIMVGVWIGTFATSRLAGRWSIDRMIAIGSGISFVFASIFLLFSFFDIINVYTVMIPIVCFCVGAGLASPAALTKALNVNPKIAGSASGIYGCCQMVIGAICASLSGIGDNPALAAACVLFISCIVAQISFRVAH